MHCQVGKNVDKFRRFTPLPPTMKLPVRIGTLGALCVGVCGVACSQDLATSLEWTGRPGNGVWPATPASTPTVPGNPRIAPPGPPAQSAPLVIPVQNPATLGTADEFGSVPRVSRSENSTDASAGWTQRQWPGQMTVAMAMLAAGVENTKSSASPETTSLDEGSQCFSLALRVGQRIKEDPASLLEVAAAEVAANPKCACEVVKAALTAKKVSADTVAHLVEACAHASPESLRMIAQCAIAVEPDALDKVQAVLARLDPNGGETKKKGGAKDAKASLEKAALTPPPDPLDLPPPIEPPVIIIPVTDPNGLRYRCPPGTPNLH